MKSKVFHVLMAILFCLLCSVGTGVAQESNIQKDSEVTGDYDLERCVKRALEANPSIVSARAALKGAEYGVDAATGEFFFKVKGEYGYTKYDRKRTTGYGYRDQWAANLSLSQPLFTGFRLLSSYQKAKLARKQSDMQLYNAELVIIKDVQSNFLNLLKARMDVKSAKDSVERLKSQLKVNNAYYEVGLYPRVDVLQAEVELATAEQNLLSARNTVSTQKAKLNTLLNLPLDAEIMYVGTLDCVPGSFDLKTCLTKAYKDRPDLKIALKSVEIAFKDAKIASSSFYPEVTADADYYRGGNDPDTNGGDGWSHAASEYWTVGVNMNWTMFEWGADYNDWKKTKETINQLQAELENTRLNAGFEVKRALLNLQEAADRILVGRKSVESAKESYRMALARYQAQVGTNNDVLDAQARVSESEAKLNTALADYNTALSALYVAMGEKNPGLKAS